MLLTYNIAVATVERRDGYRVCERVRKEIVKMNEDKASFGLRGASSWKKRRITRTNLVTCAT